MVRLHLGSPLRLSQPLSGFVAGPSLVAMFRATTVPRILPSELFPHEDRAPLSRPLCSLAVIHRRAETYWSSPFAAGFTDVHAFTQLPGSPTDYGLPFHEPRSVSRSSRARSSGIASFRRLHLLRSFPPLARPFRSTLGCPSVAGRFSRVSSPSKLDPPRLGSSTRPDLEGPNTRPRPKTRAGDSKDRSPPCRVRPS
jgi:hypothetical protein